MRTTLKEVSIHPTEGNETGLDDSKPFHESIITTLNELEHEPGKWHSLATLKRLILRTKIPANHDAIAEAVNRAFGESSSGAGPVLQYIEGQKSKVGKQKDPVI